MSNVIHAVLAVPPGVNMGMAVVELGLLSVASEAGMRIVPRRHPALLRRRDVLPDAADVRRRMEAGIGETVELHALPPADEGRLLYWGDFHHMRQYVSAVARADGGDFRRTLGLLLARGAEPEVKRSMQSFGTTLLFNAPADVADQEYGDALTELAEDCAQIWMRDPISAGMIRRLRSGDETALGVDPAVLADRPVSGSLAPHIAVFLGRTAASHPALGVAAQHLARHFDLPCRWLEWGDDRAFLALADPAIRHNLRASSTDPPGVTDVLRELSSATAVVTDAYHLALISWSWGIPAVTITAGSDPAIPASVDGGDCWAWRDKRELAGSQYGALDLVLRQEEWSDPRRLSLRLAHIVELLGTGLVAAIRAAITEDAAIARRELLRSWAQPSERPERVPSRSVLRRPVRAAAVVAVRNDLPHVDGVIRYLVLEGVDVVVIDHGSVDGSRERAQHWLGRGLLWVQEHDFHGVFSLGEQLRWKQEIFAQLDHEWVVHVDADEWLHPRRRGDRLVDVFARADEAGATVVNFEEFTFVPDRELQPDEDPRERFCSYYHFAPTPQRLMRAWRRDAGLSSTDSGGHVLSGSNIRLHEEQAVLRHYPLLSRDHARRKYLTRRYPATELSRGWHANRVNLQMDNLTFGPGPALRQLTHWGSREFERSAPVSVHCWEPHGLGL
jgi:hypothetical protein